MAVMKRRSFLAALGMAPLAGSAAVKQQAASLAGVSRGIGTMAVGSSSGWESYSNSKAPGADSWIDHIRKVAGYVSKNGVPEWKRQELIRGITVTSLDPDLAANRSFSLAAKMRIQRDRAVAKEIDRIIGRPKWEEAERKFTELMGFNL